MAYSRGKIRTKATKLRPPLLRRPGSVGNTTQNTPGALQGITVPVPLDDFDEAPTNNSVCRAASSSAQQGRSLVWRGAGEQTPQNYSDRDPLFQVLHGEPSGNGEGETTILPNEDTHTHMAVNRWNNFERTTF